MTARADRRRQLEHTRAMVQLDVVAGYLRFLSRRLSEIAQRTGDPYLRIAAEVAAEHADRSRPEEIEAAAEAMATEEEAAHGA